MPLDHAHFMRIALDEARRSKAEGNVAVGSIIVQGDTVLARGRNLVTSTHDPTAHAETVALREAGAATQRKDFAGCTLYTTFEPCPMCCGVLLASGISTLVRALVRLQAQGGGVATRSRGSSTLSAVATPSR